MPMCHKDKDRVCNEECAAYYPSEIPSGTNCLDLSVRQQAISQLNKLIESSNASAVHMRDLATVIGSVKDMMC